MPRRPHLAAGDLAYHVLNRRSHSDRPSSLEEVECPGFLILKSNLQGRRERLILLELRVETLKEDA